MVNCPNCGAPLVGGRCEYCGTLSHDAEEKIQELRRQMDEIVWRNVVFPHGFMTLFAYDPFETQKRKKE